jgi:hypothetical protein
MDKRIIFLLLVCSLSCIGSVFATLGGLSAKKSGNIEGTEEFYIKKYELEKLKQILIDAVAADTQIVPPEKTAGDFIEIDDYIEYKIQFAAGKDTREEIINRSQPHIDKLKRWCAEHYDALNTFRKSTNKITYLDGTQVTAEKFYATFISNISDEGKLLLFKICKK